MTNSNPQMTISNPLMTISDSLITISNLPIIISNPPMTIPDPLTTISNPLTTTVFQVRKSFLLQEKLFSCTAIGKMLEDRSRNLKTHNLFSLFHWTILKTERGIFFLKIVCLQKIALFLQTIFWKSLPQAAINLWDPTAQFFFFAKASNWVETPAIAMVTRWWPQHIKLQTEQKVVDFQELVNFNTAWQRLDNWFVHVHPYKAVNYN